ncbi:MAG: amino acid adenylation domain-containing protein [Richelia sp. RM2_1_2]|nr:amino acid adenylation domain-containing protein [Richelia sp. RM2_1_2]
MTTNNLQQQIFSVIAQITGHDVEDLEPDMYLEGDLGLDSIKIMEFLNGLIQIIPESQQPLFMEELPLQKLIQLQTLAEVVTATENCLSPQQPETEKVEIIHGQYFHLLGHWVVNSISLFSTLRLRGDFDNNIAWQTWKDLLNRHPMLRSRFIIPLDATRFKDYEIEVLNNPNPPEIPVTDIRHLDSKAQEQAINDELHRCLNYEWEITQFPLHRFFVFRLQDSVYQLILANEHLISDALGCHTILREFMEIYRAHVNNEQPNLPPATTVAEYQQMVQSINAWQDTESEKALVEYTNRQGTDSYLWNPANKKITSACPLFHNRRYALSHATTAALISQTREWRLPLNSLLLAAFVRTIAKLEQSNHKSILLQVPTSGRFYPEVDATNIVSSFAQNLSIDIELPSLTEDWEVLLNRIHQKVQQGIVNNCDRTQTRQMGIAFRDNIVLENGQIPTRMLPMYRQVLKSNLYCPFTGQTQIAKQYGNLEVIDYRAGGINAPGTIDILQEIFDDCLQFQASYDSDFFPLAVVDQLMEEYIAQIEALIALQTPSQQVSKQLTQTSTDGDVKSTLQEIVAQVSHNSINECDMDKDMESELGVDSLEIIRIITKLEKKLGKVNRQALLNCRTLREMAVVLSNRQSVSETPKSVEMPYLEIIAQARRTPNAIAVTDGETQITYQELDLQSNQVANYLRSVGVAPGVFVGIMTLRGPLMFVGILGILKAGGTYVPLDPMYPQERINYILEHAQIKILLSQNSLTEKLAECSLQQLSLETLMFLDNGHSNEYENKIAQINKQTWSNYSDSKPPCVNTPDDLMTVLYTSGSTGKPKGVMLNHRGYMNRLVWMQKTFQLQPGDRVAQKTSCCFDISVWEIFWPLMYGSTVCSIGTKTVKNPWLLAQWLKDNRINIMHFVPSLFGEFCNALEDETWSFPDLRWLIFSGEALPVNFIRNWIDKHGMKTGLANLYGPTEASIDVTAHIIPQRPGEDQNSIPIGKPIDNVYVKILDAQMQPVTPGEIGELWLGGVQLAKGYLKDQERTAASFRPNPFPEEIPGDFIYRTGDLAIQYPDGNIDYHGRIDNQVKIRGFRIELGEIESILNTHPLVKEAAVLAVDYENGQKRLVAYLVGNQVDQQTIKQYLAQRVPDYMIPQRWEWLSSLPKTHNGKLDRKSLKADKKGTEKLFSAQSVNNQAQPKLETQNLPLGSAQRWLIEYFEPPYQWNGYTRFLFHQPLDAETFNQAVNLLIERHSALRTVFICENEQWTQKILTPESNQCTEFYDASHLTTEQRDKEIWELIQQIGQKFQLNQYPLLKIIVVKVDESCYDISFVGHHMIGDLLSNKVIFEELWTTYTQLLGNQNPQNKPATSYADYVKILQEQEKQGIFATHVEYWKSQFPSADYSLKIPCDDQKGANTEATAAIEKFILNPAKTSTLLRSAKKYYNCSVYTLLLGVLYRLTAEWSRQSWVVISHRSHGRTIDNQQTFFNSVGNFAINFPVGINIENQDNWQLILEQITTKFDQLPMNGVTFDWISQQLPSHIYPDNNLTPIRANYLGNRTTPTYQNFEFTETDTDKRLSAPQQKRTTLVEFFFSFTDGKFNLEIEYSQNFHNQATIRQLGDRYLELLQGMLAVISYASNGSTVSR